MAGLPRRNRPDARHRLRGLTSRLRDLIDGPQRTRTAYHHGDLRNALLTAGVELARGGGPDKVVLREAARMVGVAPNSAYSHFATLVALKAAVAQEPDAAEALGVGERFIRRLIAERRIEYVKMGRHVRILRKALIE